MEKPEPDLESTEGMPKFLKSWRQIYIILVVELVALIALFYLFTVYFS